MSSRIRHCVECPECRTFYLIAFSPYSNGSYLVRTGSDSSEEYTLYCFCDGTQLARTWKWRQPKACEVSTAAHNRGYGTLDECWPLNRQPADVPWFDVSRYIDLKQN